VKTRKRHRLSAEATATKPERTDVDKRDPKRMKESQSPRTTAQKLVPLPQDQQVEASEVQQSVEPTPTTSQESMASATSEKTPQDEPHKPYSGEVMSDDSQATVPYA
jgi:hypothetical protein